MDRRRLSRRLKIRMHLKKRRKKKKKENVYWSLNQNTKLSVHTNKLVLYSRNWFVLMSSRSQVALATWQIISAADAWSNNAYINPSRALELRQWEQHHFTTCCIAQSRCQFVYNLFCFHLPEFYSLSPLASLYFTGFSRLNLASILLNTRIGNCPASSHLNDDITK